MFHFLAAHSADGTTLAVVLPQSCWWCWLFEFGAAGDWWRALLLEDGCDECWRIAKLLEDDCEEPVLSEDKKLWSLTICELWHGCAIEWLVWERVSGKTDRSRNAFIWTICETESTMATSNTSNACIHPLPFVGSSSWLFFELLHNWCEDFCDGLFLSWNDSIHPARTYRKRVQVQSRMLRAVEMRRNVQICTLYGAYCDV
jgi:hypothetical protein